MWHVLHAAPGREVQVCKFLSLHQVESYAPTFPPPRRTRPGSVRDRRHRWVFPGYVFFRVPDGFVGWDVIRWAPGVRRMLQQDHGPAILSDSIVDHIQRRLAEGSMMPARPRFARGDVVTIQSGPLRMVDALFERELDVPSRVRILVNLIGRSLPVDVDPAILRATG